MKIVNPYFLHVFLTPITGLADDDEQDQKYRQLNPNDACMMKTIIREELKPAFDLLNDTIKSKAKFALMYYLSKPSSNFERVFYSCLPPFNLPDDPRLFFVWLWEEFFPEERYILENFYEVREVPDIAEPLRDLIVSHKK